MQSEDACSSSYARWMSTPASAFIPQKGDAVGWVGSHLAGVQAHTQADVLFALRGQQGARLAELLQQALQPSLRARRACPGGDERSPPASVLRSSLTAIASTFHGVERRRSGELAV